MTALALVVAVVGLMWVAVVALRVSPLLIALFTVLTAAIIGYPFYTYQIGGIRLTVDRVMLLLLIGAFVVQRQQGRLELKALGASEWLLFALLGWLGVSMFFHDYRVNFGQTATPMWRWSTAYCIPAMLYWAARQSPARERTFAWIQIVFLVLGIYLAATGIFEIMHLWVLVFPKDIADPTLGLHFGRARGPMLTAVSYGLYLGVSLMGLWAMRDWFRRLRWLVVPSLSVLFVIGLYFSYTRSTWLGAGGGLLLVLAASMYGRARFMTVGALTTLAAAFLVSKLDKLVSFQREQSATVVRDSAECRLSFAYVSWLMFTDAPVWGVGFGQFPEAKLAYLSDRVDLPLEVIRPLVHHNTYLSLLTETGIVGLALFLALLACWGREAWRASRDPETPPWARRQAVLLVGVLGLYAIQMTFHELSYSTIDNSLLFVLAGATMGAHPAWAAAAAPSKEPLFGEESDLPLEVIYGRRGFAPK
jgi:O-antigen ligase